MTERKPPGITFESWADRQIREATERGELDNLPGAGEPLRGLNKPYDELWWVKAKMEREGLSHLPPSLALRKEAQDARAAALRAPSEVMVRKIVTEINAKIEAAIQRPPEGPPHRLSPFDLDAVLREWRERREG